MMHKLLKNRKMCLTFIFVSLMIGCLAISYQNTQVNALENGLARTPPMGWNSWNKFGYNITETIVKGVADAMVSSGMKDAGYQYIVMDDAWMSKTRDANGNLVPDPAKFPNGIKSVADYVHSKGLKIGIYEDAGTATCGGWPGSYGHYQQDANTFASWGIDYLKLDWCNSSGLTQQTQYTQMRDCLAACGRPICFSICEWGGSQPWTWAGSVGNLWRTTGDISDNWSSFTSILDKQVNLYSYAGPGHWNDPDMLEVGNGGMTTAEYQAHFSLWCILAAPLMAGNDLRSMTTTTRDILINSEVIAVDQDVAGIQGRRASSSGGLEIWYKQLNDGSRAVALFNRNTTAANMTVNWSSIGISGTALVRDLWAHADRGSFTNSYGTSVPGHGCVMVKISGGSAVTSTPTATPTPTQRVTPTPTSRQSSTPTPTGTSGASYEAESTSNTIAGACVIANVSGASGGKVVGYVGNGAANYLQFNNVYVTTAGSYTLRIYYIDGAVRSATLSVNGGTGTSISFPQTDNGLWTTVGSLTVVVTLNAGNNTIKFSNSTAYAPDFDRLVVQ